MNIKVNTCKPGTGPVVTACCPSCGRDGTFEKLSVDLFVNPEGFTTGQRRCPNPSCHCHLFFISDGANLMVTYPAQRIGFQTGNIPEQIVSHLSQAITCHAEQCYTAGAMMIRRTLEELCREKGATGDNLKKRIQALQQRIVIPQELFEGMDELRLLGNDAAHIESEAFENVGKDEVQVGVEFTKEILKAVYQYSHLLTKLRGLKKKDSASS